MVSKDEIQKAGASANTSSNTDTTPKRQVRHRRVLAAKKVNKKLDKIYRENTSNSPLLRLPPEIRNRIWVFMLGGRVLHVHVHYMRDSPRYCTVGICSERVDDEEHADEIKAAQRADGDASEDDDAGGGNGDASEDDDGTEDDHAGQQAKPDEYWERHEVIKQRRHERKCTPSDGILSLNVLKVCREIHAEAALIPFKHNVFSFESYLNAVHFFNKYRKPLHAQAVAIENITLVGDLEDRVEICKTKQKFLRSKLKGVKHITWFLQYYRGHGEDPHEHAKEQLGSLLPLMKSLPLQTAKVAVTAGRIGWYYGVSDEMCLELAEEIEPTLLTAE